MKKLFLFLFLSSCTIYSYTPKDYDKVYKNRLIRSDCSCIEDVGKIYQNSHKKCFECVPSYTNGTLITYWEETECKWQGR